MAADGHLGMMALSRVTLASAGLSCFMTPFFYKLQNTLTHCQIITCYGCPVAMLAGPTITVCWCRLLGRPYDPRETSPHNRNPCQFYKLTPKVRGALPPKKIGGQNMQNFGRFYTTSDFDREYLRNGSRNPKSEN